MADMCIEQFRVITELLQYFTATGTEIVKLSDTSGTLEKAGIGTGWTAGDTLQITGSANSNIEVTITAIAVGDGAITVSPLLSTVVFGATETVAGAIKLNQTGYTPERWQDVRGMVKLIGVINTSGNADYWIQQSWDASTVDIASTKVDITGGTAVSFDVAVVAPYARVKILSEDADQTTMRGYFGGRSRS